MMNSKQF